MSLHFPGAKRELTPCGTCPGIAEQDPSMSAQHHLRGHRAAPGRPHGGVDPFHRPEVLSLPQRLARGAPRGVRAAGSRPGLEARGPGLELQIARRELLLMSVISTICFFGDGKSLLIPVTAERYPRGIFSHIHGGFSPWFPM